MGGLEQEWKTEKYFNDEWLNLIKEHQKDLIYSGSVEKAKKWFEYLFNPSEPEKSRFRCRLCYKYYDALVGIVRFKPKLAHVNGYLADTKKRNGAMINEHANKNEPHLKVIEKLKQLYEMQQENEIKNEQNWMT